MPRLSSPGKGGVRPTSKFVLSSLDWNDMERVVAHLLGEQGWATTLTGVGADEGVDIKGQMGDRLLFAQVKHLSGKSRRKTCGTATPRCGHSWWGSRGCRGDIRTFYEGC